MKVFGTFDVRREAVAHLFRRQLPVDIGKHVDAALALGVDGNPGEGGLLALDGFNAGEVQPVVSESLGYQASALVVADESEPAGARAEARDLREIFAAARGAPGAPPEPAWKEKSLGRSEPTQISRPVLPNRLVSFPSCRPRSALLQSLPCCRSPSGVERLSLASSVSSAEGIGYCLAKGSVGFRRVH